jgi:hypothetical protein
LQGMVECEKTLKAIRDILKASEEAIEEVKKDGTIENPIQNDVVKTLKCTGYENILVEIKKYARQKKAQKG